MAELPVDALVYFLRFYAERAEVSVGTSALKTQIRLP
jgi:hypothetical protein